MTNLIPFFEWLLAASFRASAVTLVVLAVQFFLRRHLSARARYALWLPVLFVLLTPVFPESRWSVENALIAEPEPVQVLPLNMEAPSSTVLPVIVSDLPQPAPPTPIDWSSLRLNTWLLSASATLLFMGLSFAQTLHRFKKTRLPVSHELHSQIVQIAREVGLRHAPRVWTSAAIQSPAVTGLLRPVLLLPADFDREFSPREASLILQHELTHLKRHDLPLNALMCLLIVLHWFNPLLWLAFFCIRTDREAACDAQVLQNATPRLRSDYGHALLKVETAFAPLRLSLGFVGLFQRGAALRSRIQSIATQNQPHPAMKLITTVCIVLMTFLGITSAAIDAEKAPTITIKARFIEITEKSNQPTDADEVLAQTLADMPLTDKDGGPLKAVLDDAQNQTFVRRISQQKRVDLMGTHSATTRSGQKASIEVVREFALPPGNKPLEKKVGVMMDVLPTLNQENWLDLTVNPRVVEFEGFIKDNEGQQQPVFNVRKADARLLLKSGQTAVLDLGEKIDVQEVEDITDGKVVRSEEFFTRRVIVLVTATVADATPKVALAAGFTIGQSLFHPGDDIRITQVQRSGGFMTVTADYELASADAASIALHITSTKDNGRTKTDPNQHKAITKGKGRVVLHHSDVREGMPHVSFYPSGGGSSFGGIYFGTPEEAMQSRKFNLSHMTDVTKPSVIETKLRTIILPRVQFSGATIEEAIEYLRVKSREFDTLDKTGVQLILRPGGTKTDRISLDLKDVPLIEALRYCTELADLTYKIEPYAVTIAATTTEAPAKLEISAKSDAKATVATRASKIILPSVEFRDATLVEAIEFIRAKSREHDPDKKGVNILLKGDGGTAKLTLSLIDVPVPEALHYCAELANHKLSADEDSFVLTPTPPKTGAATSPPKPSDDGMPGANTEAQEKAAELRRARPQQYDFNKAKLGDVLRFLATDAGINFFALPDDNPINQKLVTFSIRASPFAALESLCLANGAVLVFDQDRWFIRAADDPEQIGKNYVLPKTQASVDTILKDIGSILEGGETKPVAGKPQPSVQFKKEQNSVYVKATRLQHTWVSAYFQGLSSSAQSRNTK